MMSAWNTMSPSWTTAPFAGLTLEMMGPILSVVTFRRKMPYWKLAVWSSYAGTSIDVDRVRCPSKYQRSSVE